MRARKIYAKNLEYTKQFAADFLADLIKKGLSKKRATVVGLYGELGAGKTTFTKEIARLFGIKRTVASPTFVLERIYKLDSKFKFEQLIHIDAYRLESGKELVTLGWNDLLSNPKNLIFIEWPEKVMDVIPKEHLGIFFTHKGEFEREIELKNAVF